MLKNNIQAQERETIIAKKSPTVKNVKEVEFERLLGQIKIKIIEYEQKNHGSSNNLIILSKVLEYQEYPTNFDNLCIYVERIKKLHQIIDDKELRKLCELKGEITKLKMKEQMDAQFQY
ncbi:1671_t:CDS:2 [Entrophospora sp. SA101]|nr:1671_t:CDS:2 [Entrophospora sp. SA101]CAJ0848538.1 10214_t:CDS:2 [Entrophospora sp. SA101]